MYFVYVLQSLINEHLYIGSTADPETRLQYHNAGKSHWTKRYRPWKMILLEEHNDKMIAQKRERYLKSGWGRQWLKKNVLKR